MNPVLKTICGSIARHWLGAFLAIVGVRIGLHDDMSRGAVAQLSDEMVANAVIAIGASAVPVVWSVVSRLMLLLRTRVALLMNRGSTEVELGNVIAEATPGAQLAAVLTADPAKL